MANKNSKTKTGIKKKNDETASSPFDKFIDDQIKREQKNTQRHESIADKGETPQQRFNKRYRETAANRTVWSKK